MEMSHFSTLKFIFIITSPSVIGQKISHQAHCFKLSCFCNTCHIIFFQTQNRIRFLSQNKLQLTLILSLVLHWLRVYGSPEVPCRHGSKGLPRLGDFSDFWFLHLGSISVQLFDGAYHADVSKGQDIRHSQRVIQKKGTII